MTTKNERKTSAPHRFQPGNPGGPGRPEGSRNKASVALDRIAEKEGQDILRKVIEAAKNGDARSAEIILSRIWPVRKGGRPVSLQIPPIDTAADVVKALGVVATAVGAGDLTADEGISIATILESKRRALETSDLEARIVVLEKERTK
jgi:Family of unknown function (DUF5681)